MLSAELQIVEADLARPEHQAAVLELISAYAEDPMGDGRPLSAEARRGLIPGLREHPTTLILLAFCGAEPVGIAVCFRGFSTFAARPLLNIHDFAVLPSARGRGIGRRLLAAVEQRARELGCCKLTLEVQEGNARARAIYAASGFAPSTYVECNGGALFLSKPLSG